MLIKYYLEPTQEQLDEIDANFYEYNLDDQVWYEEANTIIVTENPLTCKDIEAILEAADVEYRKEEA